MGWMGKIIGGALGGMIGGPIGAGIGVALGHTLDEDELGPPPGFTELNLQAQYTDDGVGCAMRFEVGTPMPTGAVLVVHLGDPTDDRLLSAPAPWCDEEGHFQAIVELDEGEGFAYLPHGVMDHARAGTHNVVVTAVDPRGASPRPFGRQVLTIPLPPPTHLGRVAILQPLVDVAMAVVRADGKVVREEIRELKEFFRGAFDLDSTELRALRDAIKAADTGDPEASVLALQQRFPALSALDVLSFLGQVAHSDGHVDAAELEVIRDVAILYGAQAEGVDALLEELGLASTHSAYAILGVDASASEDEIRRAYRERMKAYHPDRVAQLPVEFQELAHEKSVEIQAAYEVLMAEGVRGR